MSEKYGKRQNRKINNPNLYQNRKKQIDIQKTDRKFTINNTIIIF